MMPSEAGCLVIPASDVPTEEAAWREWLAEAKAMAYVPVSEFQVGAIAVGESGRGYLGTNLEFTSQPLNKAVHAEQFALTLARLHGETRLSALIVSEVPCGHCRQFLLELGQADLPIQILEPDRSLQVTLDDLFPYPFTLNPTFLRLLQPQSHGLTYPEPPNLKDLAEAALHAANTCYAPYTHTYTGLALRTQSGRIYQGSVLESAAFNPTLPALQAALVHLLSEQETFSDIQEALLVETVGSKLATAPSTWSMVKSLSPLAKLEFCPVSKATS